MRRENQARTTMSLLEYMNMQQKKQRRKLAKKQQQALINTSTGQNSDLESAQFYYKHKDQRAPLTKVSTLKKVSHIPPGTADGRVRQKRVLLKISEETKPYNRNSDGGMQLAGHTDGTSFVA